MSSNQPSSNQPVINWDHVNETSILDPYKQFYVQEYISRTWKWSKVIFTQLGEEYIFMSIKKRMPRGEEDLQSNITEKGSYSNHFKDFRISKLRTTVPSMVPIFGSWTDYYLLDLYLGKHEKHKHTLYFKTEKGRKRFIKSVLYAKIYNRLKEQKENNSTFKKKIKNFENYLKNVNIKNNTSLSKEFNENKLQKFLNLDGGKGNKYIQLQKGGKRDIRTGSRGGKYYMKGGRKVYI